MVQGHSVRVDQVVFPFAENLVTLPPTERKGGNMNLMILLRLLPNN